MGNKVEHCIFCGDEYAYGVKVDDVIMCNTCAGKRCIGCFKEKASYEECIHCTSDLQKAIIRERDAKFESSFMHFELGEFMQNIWRAIYPNGDTAGDWEYPGQIIREVSNLRYIAMQLGWDGLNVPGWKLEHPEPERE